MWGIGLEFKERSRSFYVARSGFLLHHEPLRSGSYGIIRAGTAPCTKDSGQGQGSLGPTSAKSAPAHRRHCEWSMWKSQSWGMCLGALLGCQHFHDGLDTWKMTKSIS